MQMLTMNEKGKGGKGQCGHWLTKGVGGLANA